MPFGHRTVTCEMTMAGSELTLTEQTRTALGLRHSNVSTGVKKNPTPLCEKCEIPVLSVIFQLHKKKKKIKCACFPPSILHASQELNQLLIDSVLKRKVKNTGEVCTHYPS